MAVVDGGEGFVEALIEVLVLGRAGVDDVLGLGDLSGDALLFFGEEVEGYGSGVVGFEELSSLVGELVEALLLLVEVFGVDAACEFDVVSDVGADPVEFVGVEFNMSVVVGDGCFG